MHFLLGGTIVERSTWIADGAWESGKMAALTLGSLSLLIPIIQPQPVTASHWSYLLFPLKSVPHTTSSKSHLPDTNWLRSGSVRMLSAVTNRNPISKWLKQKGNRSPHEMGNPEAWQLRLDLLISMVMSSRTLSFSLPWLRHLAEGDVCQSSNHHLRISLPGLL